MKCLPIHAHIYIRVNNIIKYLCVCNECHPCIRNVPLRVLISPRCFDIDFNFQYFQYFRTIFGSRQFGYFVCWLFLYFKYSFVFLYFVFQMDNEMKYSPKLTTDSSVISLVMCCANGKRGKRGKWKGFSSFMWQQPAISEEL